MRARHRLLVAAGLLGPACAAPATHRSTAGPNSATSATGSASSSTEAVPPRPASASVDATTTTASVTTVTILAPPAAPATTRRAATTTTTVAPFVLPEKADDGQSDTEWADRERMAGPRALASWYGAESGAHTANGDRYDPDGLTFAHLSMPFGARVRFCGPLGCVVAVCTDRGPAAWTGKTFDLSRGAFARVAPLSAGVATVTWERVG